MTRLSITPKGSFLSDSKRAGAHQDVVAAPQFRQAVEIALLSYALKLGGASADAQSLVTVGLRLEGARGVLEELMNLGNPDVPKAAPQTQELDPI